MELSKHHKRKLILHLLVVHITFDGNIVLTVKGDTSVSIQITGNITDMCFASVQYSLYCSMLNKEDPSTSTHFIIYEPDLHQSAVVSFSCTCTRVTAMKQ
jgi:hypothetical protein